MPRRPPYPSRLKEIEMGFARFAYRNDLRMHGIEVKTEKV